MQREPITRLELRPLSARSVVLSLLLGAHPPELPVRDIVRGVERFGVAETTLRVALSRMLASGDLRRSGSVYTLSDRLLDRQRRQDDALDPRTVEWDGAWEMVVVTAVGRSASDRAELRADLGALRLAELREGVWTRPANLDRPWPAHLDGLVERFIARPEASSSDLAARLWSLEEWAETAIALHTMFSTSEEPGERLAMAAGMVRHLLTDPVLPDELAPEGWPTPVLRQAYRQYRLELMGFAQEFGGRVEVSEPRA